VIYLESDLNGTFRTINVTDGRASQAGSVILTSDITSRFSAADFTVLNCTGRTGIESCLETRPLIERSNFYGNRFESRGGSTDRSAGCR
jgi:hypothetical protein